jgi:hypothetical protein
MGDVGKRKNADTCRFQKESVNGSIQRQTNETRLPVDLRFILLSIILAGLMV